MPSGYDIVIIGAGFYGCALALHASGKGYRVAVLESNDRPMLEASAINQARVHTGFHYPRSFVTALRSLRNYPRFVEEFKPAIVDDFRMLYAIARRQSKVNAARFSGMYRAMEAPMELASEAERRLFDPTLIEEVFTCQEYAFDIDKLRTLVMDRLDGHTVDFFYQTTATRVTRDNDRLTVETQDGRRFTALCVFNITYAKLNDLLHASGVAPAPLKHEWTELALVEPPAAMKGYGVTVMDGPFFSVMPYPAAGLYSLTHVRYTPHAGWSDVEQPGMPALAKAGDRWRHMQADAARYMPCLREAVWQRSLYTTKTIPLKNETDDGRPILFLTYPELPGFHSVLGSKIDNIYDLFDALDFPTAPSIRPMMTV